MPELPEVETIRRGLKEELVGQTIRSVKVRAPKLFIGKPDDLVGQTVEEIERRAKILIIKLSDSFIAIHLKMTGQLIYIPTAHPDEPLIGGHPDKDYSLNLPHKHTHVIFKFNKGTLYFNDLRKFGWMKICQTADDLKAVVAELGPEYDWPEFSLEYFSGALNNRPNIAIKQALLDQSIIAGLGNIYTDETLFCARVLPYRRVKDVDQKEIAAIYKCIPQILKVALEHGGSTLKDFRHVNGGWGSYLSFAKVYGRVGQPCEVCKTPLVSKKIAARTATYCPKCQK